nr:hypothetical protein BaRGS_013695 [Batillaria attramentaria]
MNIIANVVLRYYNESLPHDKLRQETAVDWLSMVYMLTYLICIPLVPPQIVPNSDSLETVGEDLGVMFYAGAGVCTLLLVLMLLGPCEWPFMLLLLLLLLLLLTTTTTMMMMMMIMIIIIIIINSIIIIIIIMYSVALA